MSDGHETCFNESDIINDAVCSKCNANMNPDEAVGDLCVNCAEADKYETKAFGQLKVGDSFSTEYNNDRILVFEKVARDRAIVIRDPRGIYTGLEFGFGLLAPVKVEKK